MDIKFRGIEYRSKRFVYGFLSDLECINVPIHDETTGYHGGDDVIVDPKTVGQFTGRTDIKGIEIYHGDIVQLTNGEKRSVGYHPTSCLYLLDKKGEYSRGFFQEEYLKVIGNIHQNPDLL